MQVEIGRNLRFSVGMLKYFKPVSKDIPLYVWIGVGGGALFLQIILVIIVLCWCRCSRRKQKKDFKGLEVQMSNLESNVARECREGILIGDEFLRHFLNHSRTRPN